MGNPIKDAFVRVKEDISGLGKRIKKNEVDFSKIHDDILTIKDDYKENLDNIHNKLEELFDFQKKEIKEIKRRLTILSKNGIKSDTKKKTSLKKEEEPQVEELLEEENVTGEEKNDKKKGWFSRLVDFLAEEDDDKQ